MAEVSMTDRLSTPRAVLSFSILTSMSWRPNRPTMRVSHFWRREDKEGQGHATNLLGFGFAALEDARLEAGYAHLIFDRSQDMLNRTSANHERVRHRFW